MSPLIGTTDDDVVTLSVGTEVVTLTVADVEQLHTDLERAAGTIMARRREIGR